MESVRKLHATLDTINNKMGILKNALKSDRQVTESRIQRIQGKMQTLTNILQEKERRLQQKLAEERICDKNEEKLKQETEACKAALQGMKEEQQEAESSYKTQIVECNKRLRAAERFVDSAQKENEKLKESLKTAKRTWERVKQVEASLCQVEEEKNGFQKKLETKAGERKALEDQAKELEKDCASMKEENDQLWALHIRLKTEKKRVQEKNNALQMKLAQLEAKSKTPDYDAKIKALEEKHKRAEADLKAQVTQMDSVAQQNWITACEAKKEMEEAQRETATLRRKLAEVSQNVAAQGTQTSEGQSAKMKPLKKDVCALDKSNFQQEGQKEKQRETQELMNRILSDFEYEKSQYEDQLLAEQLQRKELEEQIQALEEEFASEQKEPEQEAPQWPDLVVGQSHDTPQQKSALGDWAKKVAGQEPKVEEQILIPCGLPSATPQANSTETKEDWPGLQKESLKDRGTAAASQSRMKRRKFRWLPFKS